jgi:hypothetical protein
MAPLPSQGRALCEPNRFYLNSGNKGVREMCAGRQTCPTHFPVGWAPRTRRRSEHGDRDRCLTNVQPNVVFTVHEGVPLSVAAGNGTNAGPAVATLTVNSHASNPVTLSKSFRPRTIKRGGASTLTITLTDPDHTVANLTAPLSDRLPAGAVISTKAAPTAVENTRAMRAQPPSGCPAGSIPSHGSRTVAMDVTAAAAGSHTNTLPAGALETNLGSNTRAAYEP